MNILDKLEKITGVDLSELKKIENNVKLVFTALSSNQIGKNNQKIEVKGNAVILNIENFNAKQLPELKALTREIVGEHKLPILEVKAAKLLTDFRQVDALDQNLELVAFFRGKVPSTDLEILRQALYIKIKFDNHEDTRELKYDVIRKYGNRGRNICNLVSAGYFSSQIKPLYNELISQDTFSPQDFESAYERIVTEMPYAFFVSGSMSQEGILQEVQEKIVTAKKYGIRYLNIHGIGHDNVDKIYFTLEKIRSDFTVPEEISRTGNVIVVKIHF